MQGGRCVSESCRNIVDLNQQSVLSTGNVNHSTWWWGNLLNPGEDQVCGDDLVNGKDDVHRVNSESGSYHRENYVTDRVLNLSGRGSDYSPGNTDHIGGSVDGTSRETRERMMYGLSLNNHGASSSTCDYSVNNGEKSGSSLGKRKALDGGNAQLYAGRSSSARLPGEINFVQPSVPASSNALGSAMEPDDLNLRIGIEKREIYSEGSRAQLYAGRGLSSPLAADNIMQHTGPTSQDALASITTGASPMDWSFTSQPEQLNLRIGIEDRETYSEFFPPPNITDIGERLNVGLQEPNLFIFPFTDTALRPSGSSSGNQPSRSFGITDASLIINSSNPSIQSHESRVPENTGGMLHSHWSGSLDPQSGRPLKSFRFSGGRPTAFRDAQSLRNHSDFSASDTTTVSTQLLQDPPALNLALPSQSLLPSSRSASDLSMQNLRTGWTPPQNRTGPNQQGVTQYSPQLPLQPSLRSFRSHRGQFPVIPPTPPSSTEGVIPSFSSQGQRSALFIGEQPDPTSRQHGLAGDIEARQRLVRQVRNTMQRGVNRRAQNVTIGAAELHDRHREMRLDIDNMSYEELLALEERIGNVCTGLSDEIIMRSMKRRKHLPMRFSSNSEPCCICQEEFVAGDDIGATVCEHEFHFKCIKQWLSLKNQCPICKKKALDG